MLISVNSLIMLLQLRIGGEVHIAVFLMTMEREFLIVYCLNMRQQSRPIGKHLSTSLYIALMRTGSIAHRLSRRLLIVMTAKMRLQHAFGSEAGITAGECTLERQFSLRISRREWTYGVL